MNMQILDVRRDTSGGYKVDGNRGSASVAYPRSGSPFRRMSVFRLSTNCPARCAPEPIAAARACSKTQQRSSSFRKSRPLK